MPTWKLLLMFVGWILASVMMAVVTAIVVTELLLLLGFVDQGESSYSVSLNVVFVVTLIALVAVPFVFRRRFDAVEPPPET